MMKVYFGKKKSYKSILIEEKKIIKKTLLKCKRTIPNIKNNRFWSKSKKKIDWGKKLRNSNLAKNKEIVF